jgi:two-component system cell cycle response regulator DivK
MLTVLIADDNADGRELLRDHLEAWGFEVLEARDGQEALINAARYLPDAILLDVQMPRLDGFSVLRKLREDERLSATPALAITACAWNGTRDRALQAGFNACFAKPVDFRALRDELQKLLRAAFSEQPQKA